MELRDRSPTPKDVADLEARVERVPGPGPAGGPAAWEVLGSTPSVELSGTGPGQKDEPARTPATAADEPDDPSLVQRFKGGDESAFNMLVTRYSGKILTLATYFLKDADEAYDVAQEVFLKVHRALRDFRGDAKFSTWIHTIGVNTCKNRLSWWKRLTIRKKEYEHAQMTRPAAWTPEQEVEAGERVRIIREQIQELPEKFRLVIILKDIKGLSYEEIGATLGLNEGTVKSRLHRAREALAARLLPILRSV